MIVEYDLEGTLIRHMGLFETTGFWVKIGADVDDITKLKTSYKMWSHSSFTYETTDENLFLGVWKGLVKVLRTKSEFRMEGVGFIRVIA